jgi:hypothetical protein
MATRVSHQEERQAYAEFARAHAEEDYRTRLAELYAAWRQFNDGFFRGRLLEPHLALDRTAPRSLGHCAPTTGYGGQVQITLNAGLVFGSNRDWVVRPWPTAQGTKRFLDDLLLRLTVRQFVVEVVGDDERGYRGFGPQFVAHANRIGGRLGLAPVVKRRWGADDTRPVARGWPHCVRPDGYYGGDVTQAALDLAGDGTGGSGDAAPTPSQGVLELLQYLLRAGRADEAQRLVNSHLKWLCAGRESRWPAPRLVEAGVRDVDDSPLGEVTVRPEWLAWNGGTVLRLAEGIYQCRNFIDLPLLAEALEAAGCDDGRMLRHLRERMGHSRRCWVLRRLLSLEAE